MKVVTIYHVKTNTILAQFDFDMLPKDAQAEAIAATKKKRYWEKIIGAETRIDEIPDGSPVDPSPQPEPAPGPAPSPEPHANLAPRYWYGAVNSVAEMTPDEQRAYVRAAAHSGCGIILEYLGWKKGEWWLHRDALRKRLTPFFEEAKRLRVPLHIYVINTNSEPVGALPIETLRGFADDVIALADPTKDRILACNEADNEKTSPDKRLALTSYVHAKWTGALVSYGLMDNPDHARVVVLERHPQTHTDFKRVAHHKPTFFVSDNQPMISWLSGGINARDAKKFDLPRVVQWKHELPPGQDEQGYYGWMHEHYDAATIQALG